MTHQRSTWILIWERSKKKVSFYTLITASLLLISARLQDIIGKREIFLLGMIIYGVGDLIAALSPNAMVLDKNTKLCVLLVAVSIAAFLAFEIFELRYSEAGNLSVFLLSVLKLSAFETGLMLMPMTVGMMLASFIAPKMAMKIGHKYTMILGFAIAIGVVLTLGAVSGLREAINTYTPMNLSYEAFRANAEMYMQKMGHVDPLTLTVKDQEAYQKIVNAIYQDAMGLVMMVVAGLMVLGIILTLSLMDIKKQKSGENEKIK